MQQLEDIMHKEMSRKEFLATVGFGIASILGFSSILRFILGRGQQAQHGHVTNGYGASTYGK